MRAFLARALPGYIPPTRQTTTKQMRWLYAEYRAKLKLLLVKYNHMAITTDMWRSRAGHQFACLTVHFFNDDYELISLPLSFRRFYGRNTANRLKDYIQREFIAYDILEKVCSITTGNRTILIKNVN